LDKQISVLAALFLIASVSLVANGYGLVKLWGIEGQMLDVRTQSTQTYQKVTAESMQIANLSSSLAGLQNQIQSSTEAALSQARKETYDVYMMFGGVLGEATESGHKDWIEILSFSWGLHKTGTVSQSEEWKVLKALDKSTPKLYDALDKGTDTATVLIELVDQGTGRVFLRYTMSNVIISSISVGPGILKEWDVSSPKLLSCSRPIEQISLNFQKITMTYMSSGATTADTVEWQWTAR